MFGPSSIYTDFRADDLLETAWREAVRVRDDRAFFARQSAEVLTRVDADRFASVDGLAQARAVDARHQAELAAAERRVAELSERMWDRCIPFHDGSVPARLSTVEEADAYAAVQGVLAGLDAANDAGVPAPVALIFAAPRFVQMGAR